MALLGKVHTGSHDQASVVSINVKCPSDTESQFGTHSHSDYIHTLPHLHDMRHANWTVVEKEEKSQTDEVYAKKGSVQKRSFVFPELTFAKIHQPKSTHTH